jgi:hypothetical protein
MMTFVSDIIPRIQRFSKKLDASSFLTKQHWVAIDEVAGNKQLYIFKTNNELIISNNGRVERAKWEYIGYDTLIVDRAEGSFLFKQGFLDDRILALKLDNCDEYLFMVGERYFDALLNSIFKINLYLNEKYLPKSKDSEVPITIIKYSTKNGIFEVHQKNPHDTSIGDLIFLNGEKVPDGIYKLGFLLHISVKNGSISDHGMFPS